MQLHLIQRFWNYTDPWILFWYSVTFWFKSMMPGTPAEKRGRGAAFAELFKAIGPHFVERENESVVPRLVAGCHGTILELGPAIGSQIPRYNKSVIKHVYGVEINPGFKDVLTAMVKNEGFADMYTPIIGSVEDAELLQTYGIMKGSMDCILSIQVLCSVEHPAKTAALLYDLLKPGGELIFWEHHGSHDPVTGFMQRLWDLIWPVVLGGCTIHRFTKDIFMESGSWEVLETGDNEDPFNLFPRAWARLRKVEKT